MKKSILLNILLFCFMKNIYAQSEIYVIVTSVETEEKGVWHSLLSKWDGTRDQRHVFTLFDRARGNHEQSFFIDSYIKI